MTIPVLDPQVKYIGASRLRQLTAKSLAELSGAIVVQGADASPLAVIVPYATWQRVQEQLRPRITEIPDIDFEPEANELTYEREE